MPLPRILTALVGIPILLAAIHAGGYPLAALMAGVSLLSAMELFALLDGIGMKPRRVLGYPAVLIMFAAFILPALSDPRISLYVSGPPFFGLVLTCVMVIMVISEIFYVQSRSFIKTAVTFFAAIFCAWPLAHVVLLRELAPLGKEWCLFLFVTIWASDTIAYLVGTTLGSRKIAPKVSPKKTLEGFIGAFLGAVLAASVLWLTLLRPEGVPYAQTAILGGLVLGVMGQLSDLVESMIKREAGVKDSSNFLPGHGGILDRFDSFILTAPLMYYYLALLK